MASPGNNGGASGYSDGSPSSGRMKRTSSANTTISENHEKKPRKRTKIIINDSNSNDDSMNVRVVARLRPLSTKELSESSQEAITVLPENIVNVDTSSVSRINSANTPSRTFDYDAAFGPQTSQEELYQTTVGDMVRINTFKGFNTTSTSILYY